MLDFQKKQRAFTEAIRQPHPSQDYAIKIYQNLVFNNYLTTFNRCFPVTLEIIAEQAWHDLIWQFLREYRNISPYSHQLPKDFLNYIEQSHLNHIPDFLFELMHYECLELEVELAEDQDPPICFDDQKHEEHMPLYLSQTAHIGIYQYPVHTIGKDNVPIQAHGEKTIIIVYRNAEGKVSFMKINTLTAQLLQNFIHGSTIACTLDKLSSTLHIKAQKQVLNLMQKGILGYTTMQHQEFV